MNPLNEGALNEDRLYCTLDPNSVYFIADSIAILVEFPYMQSASIAQTDTRNLL